ncbi:MAG: chromosomal replication initiator DnaA, partial [Rhodobacteraceae bacterium]|nr:chromosomal replication initiator DnaA [Paracoccaceae bacterium]
MTPRQTTLRLDLPARMDRGSFVPSACNATALGMLSLPLPGGRLVLHGPEGAGKTHLGQIWASARGAQAITGSALNKADIATLGQSPAIWIDDAARVAKTKSGQTALFHLLNLAAANHAEVLLSARAPARDWGISLPDLASRLDACTHVALAPPDDALLAAVLEKLFADRQVTIPDTLIP